MLVYTSRIATSSLQFKVHGQLSLKGMAVSSGGHFVILIAGAALLYSVGCTVGYLEFCCTAVKCR